MSAVLVLRHTNSRRRTTEYDKTDGLVWFFSCEHKRCWWRRDEWVQLDSSQYL